MKIKSLLLVTTLSASFSTLAAEDCNPNRDPFCGDGGGGGLASLGKAAEVLLVSGAVAAGVGLYYIFRNGDEDKETSARMLADYHNGKGLRLISYENIVNVSLFTPKPYIVNDPLTNLTNQHEEHGYTYNLVNISVHWQ